MQYTQSFHTCCDPYRYHPCNFERATRPALLDRPDNYRRVKQPVVADPSQDNTEP